VVCGAEGWVDIENIGNNKNIWLKTYLELPKGIPLHDTFWGVFSKEDHRRIRKDQGPENFAILSHMALNLLKQ